MYLRVWTTERVSFKITRCWTQEKNDFEESALDAQLTCSNLALQLHLSYAFIVVALPSFFTLGMGANFLGQ